MNQLKRVSWAGVFFVCLCVMALLGVIVTHKSEPSARADYSAIKRGDQCRIGHGEWFPSVDGICYAECEHISCWKTPPRKRDARILISDDSVKTGELMVTTGPSYMLIDKKSLDMMLKDHPETQLQVVMYEEDENGNMTRVREPACLAKMEAAMRAVEQYAGYAPSSGLFIESNYQAAKREWSEVKRECWRQP